MARSRTQFTRRSLILSLVLASFGCANPIDFIGIRFVYKRAALPDAQIFRDISYDAMTGSPKQRLDLYTPASPGWPTVVFVHGGSWTEGDRALKFGGADVYGNIGRFLAQHGYGTAVISYRLIPDVDWRTQADDVAKAVAWVHEHIAAYGGLRDTIVMMGHSAGAQLAVRIALDAERLRRFDVPQGAMRGVIAVSGAGYDMADQETYALGADPEFYAERFQLSADDTNWQRDGSILSLVSAAAPPALVIYAGGESRPLQRQSQRFEAALTQAGAKVTLLEVPGLSHTRIVMTLSRDDRPAGTAILEFLRATFSADRRPE
jgi:acetyl esterase/lipase